MIDNQPEIFIISGCNGSGKSTSALELLPGYLECIEFINADSIAKGISPFNVDSVAIKAGRIMLDRIKELIKHRASFAFETTLSTRSFHRLIQNAQQEGYLVHIIYFWLESSSLAINRVNDRVLKGGHSIPKDVVQRRYKRSIQNLLTIYMNSTDTLTVYNNSENKPVLVAEFDREEKRIYQQNIWNNILTQAKT